MVKEIKLKHIVKIQHSQMKIFEAEDDDFPDRRIVVANERAMQYWLDKITSNKEEQNTIYNVINKHNFNNSDYTFKPICDDLRKLGYTILEGK